MHWSRLVYQQFYEKQNLQYTGLDHRIDSPIVEQDQWFVGLKTTKMGSLGLSAQSIGLLIHSVGLSGCRTIARRNIEMNPETRIQPTWKVCKHTKNKILDLQFSDPALVAIFSILLPLTKNVSNPKSWVFTLFPTFMPSTTPSQQKKQQRSFFCHVFIHRKLI